MSSTTSNRHRMRCRDCKRNPNAGSGRFTLRRDPVLYVRAVKCPSCGSHNVASVEAQRIRELSKQDRCNCAGYPFPHRKGSLKFCQHYTGDVSDDDLLHYQACLETKRRAWY